VASLRTIAGRTQDADGTPKASYAAAQHGQFDTAPLVALQPPQESVASCKRAEPHVSIEIAAWICFDAAAIKLS
jgi:hypothetical protein